MFYLKGLHALRFFAALLVILFHTNGALRQIDSSWYSAHPIFTKGHVAVDFFFIISGFLLSFLACREFNAAGVVNIRRFFIRRILRIFPLYYMIVFLGFLSVGILYPMIYDQSYYTFPPWEGFLYYLLFIPNWVIAKWDLVGPTYALWSIGVEEQFYLLFPIVFIIPLIKSRVHWTLPIAFTGYLIFHIANFYELFGWSETIYFFINKTLRFHFLLWGCLLGYWYHQYPTQIHHFFRYGILQWLSLSVLGYLLFTRHIEQDPQHLFVGLAFSVLMISLVSPSSKLSLEYRPLIYGGTISYGIYVFHPFISVALRFLLFKVSFLHQLVNEHLWVFYAALMLCTFVVAHLSYHYFEKYFLDKKKSFQ